jgi:SAM-dependent methyltransferase
MRLENILKGTRYLFITWATSLPRIVYRSTISLVVQPKESQKFIHQVLNAQDIESDDPVLGSVDATDLASSKVEPIIIGPYHIFTPGSTHNLLELASLAYLMQALQPLVVFEIGTFVGRTTRLLALNTPIATRIFTLDLPQERVMHKIGEAFRGTSESQKITQLNGDSRNFDYSPWHNKCDFVWIDGCHDYPYVVQDTQAALNLCRPGGWILWHDYRHTAWWSGITRVVWKLARTHPGVRHIRGTTIAAFQAI